LRIEEVGEKDFDGDSSENMFGFLPWVSWMKISG
jgi:hypothetical protein